MKIHGKRRTSLPTLYVVLSALFLPFVVFHFAWITPVVELSCLCPDGDSAYSCCCNCSKCVERRGGLESYCHVNPNRSAEVEIKEGTNISFLVHAQRERSSSALSEAKPRTAKRSERLSCSVVPGIPGHVGSHKGPRVSLETLGCDCNNHIKEISLDVKLILQRAPISGACTLPVARLCLADDRRPPEAIPCHPEKPG